MKNILFASTALVAFAGAASAEVLISGSAEMGIVDTNEGDFDTQFLQSVDVRFTMTGETDNGLAFGATVDLDDATDAGNADSLLDPAGAITGINRGDGLGDNTGFADYTVFISGAFGTLTMGDTDGALDWALQEVAFGAGAIADDHTAHDGYLGSYLDGSGDGQVLRYDYSVGDFGFAVSAETDADGAGESDNGFAIGAKYSLDLSGTAVNFGIGYQDAVDGDDSVFGADSDLDAIGISVDAALANGLRLGIAYTTFDGDDLGGAGVDVSGDHLGLGVAYGVGAVSVSANYGRFDLEDGLDDSEGYGMAVNYDLGGGAVIQLGYGHSDRDGDDRDTASFGLSLSF